jgi:cell division protein FtsQ
MARRRRNTRRRRKGRFAFLYKLLTFLVICGVIVAALAVFFKVDQVEVTGNTRYTGEEVVEASGVSVGDNLFLLNKYEVAGRITENLAYVESVRISRRMPDTLCIEIGECEYTAGVEQDGQLWMLCAPGKLVEAASPEEAGSCALVTGLTLQDPQVGQMIESEDTNVKDQLLDILAMLSQKGMFSQVQEIHLEDPGMITIRYMGNFVVQFPWHADFDYKLDYLAAVMEKLEENERGTINLMQDGEARFIPD